MPDFAETLDRVAEDVLGTMFFSAVLGPGAPPDGDDVLSAIVEFTGSTSGALGLSADRLTADSHASAFLGIPESAPVEEVHAIVGELANVICGATLAQIFPAGQFQIAPPGVFTGQDAARRVDRMPVIRRFELPEGALSVGLSIDAEDRPA